MNAKSNVFITHAPSAHSSIPHTGEDHAAPPADEGRPVVAPPPKEHEAAAARPSLLLATAAALGGARLSTSVTGPTSLASVSGFQDSGDAGQFRLGSHSIPPLLARPASTAHLQSSPAKRYGSIILVTAVGSLGNSADCAMSDAPAPRAVPDVVSSTSAAVTDRPLEMLLAPSLTSKSARQESVASPPDAHRAKDTLATETTVAAAADSVPVDAVSVVPSAAAAAAAAADVVNAAEESVDSKDDDGSKSSRDSGEENDSEGSYVSVLEDDDHDFDVYGGTDDYLAAAASSSERSTSSSDTMLDLQLRAKYVTPTISYARTAVERLLKELRAIFRTPDDSYQVVPNDSNFLQWQVCLLWSRRGLSLSPWPSICPVSCDVSRQSGCAEKV
jgi:hypothetical protein